MDDKTYKRLFIYGQCVCGFKPRSMRAEAFHRHNFPFVCKAQGRDKLAKKPKEKSK